MKTRLDPTEINTIIKQRISGFSPKINGPYSEGTIIGVGNGIIHIYGLEKVKYGEKILLPDGNLAITMNLERDLVSAIVIGRYNSLREGMKVKCTGKMLEVPVGFSLLGRIVNAIGKPIDGKGPIKHEGVSPIETNVPSIIERKSIDEPVQTGYKIIDAMIPIGKGQRELIIGDRQTGKSTIALDIIINQKYSGIKCIYVAIGQKSSTIINAIKKLELNRALQHTIVVVSSSSDPAALQYIAPYSGCTMGEYFRDRGEDALIIYDDLSKQAIAYRQISLLLRRPPGREAYPGDIFYLHSRLLERSARVSENYVSTFTKGKVTGRTGSLTAFPIVETQSGDISSFIPTNTISITDGQIFLTNDLFNSGIRPAIDPGTSVSRVGNIAQTEIIKVLSSGIRNSLAQYRELSNFSQFSSELDKSTRNFLDYGERIVELLKQKQHSPMSVSEQSILLFALKNDYLKDIKIENIRDFEYSLIDFLNSKENKLMKEINETGKFNEKVKRKFINILDSFKKEYFY